MVIFLEVLSFSIFLNNMMLLVYTSGRLFFLLFKEISVINWAFTFLWQMATEKLQTDKRRVEVLPEGSWGVCAGESRKGGQSHSDRKSYEDDGSEDCWGLFNCFSLDSSLNGSFDLHLWLSVDCFVHVGNTFDHIVFSLSPWGDPWHLWKYSTLLVWDINDLFEVL